ncbi:D(5)-like dopamine receptor [Orbicella faveolata]|uniref:D(5)-like dopamine receptor n=1 Tax=Orbicella faveolata TaxID=48498 RepID=UPI0009E5DFA3|nr:D(5)-like dopamine receptor [Orbicella faveolata]
MDEDSEFYGEGNETLDDEFVNGFSAHYDVYPVVLAVLIIVANGTALALVVRKKKLQTVTNGVLASLATSDLLAGLLGIPLYLVCNLTYHTAWCLSSAVFWRFVSISTVLHLTILTMHLFATVGHLTRYEFVLRRKATTCLVCTAWLCAAFVSLVQLSWIIVEDDRSEEERLRVHLTYSIAVLVLFLGVPLATIVCCQLRIFAFICVYKRECKARVSEKSNSSDDQPFAKVASTWKTAVVFAGMSAVYLICWAPYFILELVVDDAEMESLPLWAVYMLFYFTRFTASAVNPILFVVGKSDFRRALREWLHCCSTAKAEEEADHGTMHSLVQSQRP